MRKGGRGGKAGELKISGNEEEEIRQAFKKNDGKFQELEKTIFTKELLTYLLDEGKTSLEEGINNSRTRKKRPSATVIIELYIRCSKGKEDVANNCKAIMLAVKHVDFKKNNFDAILKPLLSQEFDVTYTGCDGNRLGEELISLLNKVNCDVFRRKVFEYFISNLESFEKEEAPRAAYLRNLVILFFQNAVEKRMIDLCERLIPFGLGVVLPLVGVAELYAHMKKETAEGCNASNKEKKQQLDACVQRLQDREKISPFVANVFHHVLLDQKFDFSLAILPPKAELIMALNFAAILGAKDVVENLLTIAEVANGVNEEFFLTEDIEEQAQLDDTYKGFSDKNVSTFMRCTTVLKRVIIFEGDVDIGRILWPVVKLELEEQAINELLVLAIMYSSAEMVEFLLEEGAQCEATFSFALNSEFSLSKLKVLNKKVPLQLNKENVKGMTVLDILMSESTTFIHDLGGIGLQVGPDKFGVSVFEKIKKLLSFKAVCNKDFYGILLNLVLSDESLYDDVIYVLNMILGSATYDLTLLGKALIKDEATIRFLKNDAAESLVLRDVIKLLSDKIKQGNLSVVQGLEDVYLLCTNAITSAGKDSRELKRIEKEQAEEIEKMKRNISTLEGQLSKAQRAIDTSKSTTDKGNLKNNKLAGQLHASEKNNARLSKEITAASQEVSSLKDALEEEKRLAKDEKEKMGLEKTELEYKLSEARRELGKSTSTNGGFNTKLSAVERNKVRLSDKIAEKSQEIRRLKGALATVKRLAKVEKDEMGLEKAELEQTLLEAHRELGKLTSTNGGLKTQLSTVERDNVRLSDEIAEKTQEMRALEDHTLATLKRLARKKREKLRKEICGEFFDGDIDESPEAIRRRNSWHELYYDTPIILPGQKKVADTDGGDKDRSASSRDSGSSGAFQSANSGRSSADPMDGTAVSAASSPNDCAGGSSDSGSSHAKPTANAFARGTSRPARQAQSNGQKGPGSAVRSGIFTGNSPPGRAQYPALGKSKQASGRRPAAL